MASRQAELYRLKGGVGGYGNRNREEAERGRENSSWGGAGWEHVGQVGEKSSSDAGQQRR